MKDFPNLPTPRDLFRAFDSGAMPREEFQAAMAEHARVLIAEMEEMHQNPIAAYIERLRNRAAANTLAKRIGETALREILSLLGSIEHFPPAHILWNASHRDMPLHCFFRMRHEPVFRILRLDIQAAFAKIVVEYGGAKKRESTREEITLQKDRFRRYQFVSRSMLS